MIGAVIGGISNIIGSALSADAQRQTNEMNYKISRENNEKMLQAMREQTEAEQSYNSMSAQMQRAMMAGVNPMLLAGAQPTSASSSGVPSLDTPVMENPLQSFGSLGANLGSAAMQAEQIALQEKQIDIAEFKSKIDMLQTLGELGGSADWSSDELKGVIRAVFGDSFDAGSIGSFARDNMVMTRIKNTIESSNLDVNKKKYLFGWLDEFTNAQYINLLSDTERNQTISKVNRSIAELNKDQKKYVQQAIKNMAEEWNTLHAKGQMDLQRLTKFAEYLDAEVKKLQQEANLTEIEARYWVWQQVLSHPLNSSFKLFGVGGSRQTIPTRWDFPYTIDNPLN